MTCLYFAGSLFPFPDLSSSASPHQPVQCKFYPNCTKPNCLFYHPPKKVSVFWSEMKNSRAGVLCGMAWFGVAWRGVVWCVVWRGLVWCDVMWGLGQSALGHILQNWLTDVSIISWAACGRTISVGQTFGRARQTSKVPTACLWGAPFLNKGPICTRPYLVFVSWIGRPIHQTKTKFDLVRLGPMWMWLVHWITYCSCFILLNQQLCRFGASCTRDSCMFSHPPKPSELKWVKTPSHIRYIHLFTINPICLLWSQWKVILLWWFVVVLWW